MAQPKKQQNVATPLVSILIPCYNAEAWIGQCVRSALDQDYRNKEIIVVDDGSSDGSRKIIEDFAGRIQFHQGPHAGGNAARNQLTRLARGEWLQYLDADDYLLQDKISSQVRLIGEHGNAIDVIVSPVSCYNALRPLNAYTTPLPAADVWLSFIEWGPFQTTGMLFRREAVLKAGGWKEGQPCCQEHELLLRLLMVGNRCGSGRVPLSVYRVGSEATVSRTDPMRVIRTRMELTDRAVEYLQSTGRYTRAHGNAVIVASLESARTAYAKGDTELAAQLYAKARELGRWRLFRSVALPLRYRITLLLFGFKRAELLAAWRRRYLPHGPAPSPERQ